MILHGSQCFCADTYPSRLSLVDDDKCNYPCPGYGLHACGSLKDAYSVYSMGIEVDVQYDDIAADKPALSSSIPTSTSIGHNDQPTSIPSYPALADISDAAHQFSTAANKFAKKIQFLFNKFIGGPGSERTEQSSEETEVLQEVGDL